MTAATQEPHPVGVGVGITGGASAGAAIGAVAGPVGSLLGAVVGSVAGAVAGDSAANVLTTPHYLTSQEICQRLNLKRTAVYRLIRLGKLKATNLRTKKSPCYRVAEADFQEYVRCLNCKPAAK